MTRGLWKKEIRWKQAAKLWVFCFIGNRLGALIVALLFHLGDFTAGGTAEIIAAGAAVKMQYVLLPLLLCSVFCNILVCLPVW